ncbi:MAG TPA: branched-chain amino acid aminotransferase [Chitinispirillaceae bacterium]|nr:branched-chain amino acid aminotransferase [Chitinispirillaceae bacterium]
MKNIDWRNLGFKYTQTDCFVTCSYTNGKWGEIEIKTDPELRFHLAATCFHYGQACFEGMKAFTQLDGTVAVFRPEMNAARMQATAERLMMQGPPEGLFLEAVNELVRRNIEWVPPYGTGASLYIRPLLVGSSPHIGVHPSEDYLFLVLCMPVGPYYKNGFAPVNAYIQRGYDRAAPRGVGHVKAAGNYAAGMLGDFDGKAKGYPICLYLDSATHQYIDEFGTSNFFGITKDNRYVTPASSSILPSITNSSLQVIASDFGMKVEKRQIPVTELPEFAEIGACGTAAVITPVYSITDGDKVYTFGKQDEAGETLTRFYKQIQGIQYGELEDKHQWMVPVKTLSTANV